VVIQKILKKLKVDMSEFMRMLIPRSDPADIIEEAVEALGSIDRFIEVLAVIYHISPGMYEYLMAEIKDRLAEGRLNFGTSRATPEIEWVFSEELEKELEDEEEKEGKKGG